jgi:ribosomal protein S18 acetylase RimI-like enzyme
VRPLVGDDHEWAAAFLDAEMGGRMQARMGELLDVLAYPGLVVEGERGDRVGLLTYRDDGEGATEVTVIVVNRKHEGGGTALLDALRGAVSGPIWLVTTNDNVDALRFYQRRGFRLREVRRGGVDESRRVKPHIPVEGEYGIPRHDELVLDLED